MSGGAAGRVSGRRYDREIFGLALPALGALAAEPTYVLVDTAIVGHLGTPQLAALAIAATLLSTAVTLFNFLTYGTTARVARLHGAGEVAAAGRIGSQALWLSLALGGALLALIVLLAAPAVALMGGSGETARMAVSYLRISALGVPFAMVALAGQGFLRGVGNLRTPRSSSSSPPTPPTPFSRSSSSTASGGGSRGRRGGP